MDSIGDAFVVVSMGPASTQCQGELLDLAVEMQRIVEAIDRCGPAERRARRQQQVVMRQAATGSKVALALRIGVAEGDIIAGVLGSRQSRFQVIGPALSMAEDLQREASPGEIRVAPAVAAADNAGRFRFVAGGAGEAGPDAASGLVMVWRDEERG